MSEDVADPSLARLAFWARNMTAVADSGMSWPGFSYTDAEWARFRTLAALVPWSTYRKFVFVNAVVFIVLAAIGIGVVFLPLANLLFPIPAETSALKFSLLLAGCSALILGLGLPVSLRAAAALSADRAILSGLRAGPGDAELGAKVAWQINRMVLIMCGLLVPGILIFIAYDLEAGPLIVGLKWLAVGLMAVSVAVGLRRRGRT